MTAREKFEARLKELGLESKYGPDDFVGTVLPDGSIIVLGHIQGDPRDGYTECHYPPFEELWKDPEFRNKCKEFWYKESDDHELISKLAYWLDIHDKFAECPLFPVDLYWMNAECDWFNYKDDDPEDPEEEEYQKFLARTAEFIEWSSKTLDYIRAVACEAVRTELNRGHNLYDYEVENGQDHFLDYSFSRVLDEKVNVDERGELVLVCSEAVANEKVGTFEIPFYDLSEKQILDIYAAMK